MKNYLKSWTSLLVAAFMAPILLSANLPNRDYGLPGDDFSLEGALDLFKSCNSLEEFEHELNSPNNTVNNLDLNYNGRIDYLRVVDHDEGDFHAIVIQALIDQGMSQDVAVIQVKRNRNGEAVVQIVGDEDLYGTAKIVEPYPYDDVAGPDYYDNYYDHYSPTVFVNVWSWPSIRFIFAPRYVVWVSPYYYDYYPVWYSPWRPYSYYVWHTRTVVHHHYHYCVAPAYRAPEVHHYYGSRRVYSPVVHQRTERYVADHGGRSNFDYTKRNDKVNTPRTRSLDGTESANVSTRSDKTKELSPVRSKSESTRPQTNDRNLDKSQSSETATRPDRPREQSPVNSKSESTKPSTSDRNLDKGQKSGTATRPDKPREQSPAVSSKPKSTQPQAEKPRVEKSAAKERQRESSSSNSLTESRKSKASSPSRESQPKSNNNVSSQKRSTSSSPKATTKADRKSAPTAAPKANRSETSSRSKSSSSSKSATKNQSSQARKGKG